MKREIVYSIPEEFHQETVEHFLKARSYTHQAIVRIKKTPQSVILNGNWVHLNAKGNAGDRLTILISEDANSDGIVPGFCDMDIVYEDEDIVVVNKPCNMPIHPSLNHYGNTLANALMGYYRKQNRSFVFRCINRLDRDTTGLTLIAKHFLSAGILHSDMEKRSIRRTYVAFCEGMEVVDAFREFGLQDALISKGYKESSQEKQSEGVLDQDRGSFSKGTVREFARCGRIDLPVFRENGSLIRRCIHEKGERAITNYRHLDKVHGIDVVEFQLETGRTHQIRVHMSGLGYPLLGDELYGGNCEKIKRTALHAKRLEFRHPISGEGMVFEADLHEDMAELLLLRS